MSKQNETAKNAIKAYLDKRANEDPLFATSYSHQGKSIDECFRYILCEAKKRGNSVCMTDDEVFGLAVHYYDETDIKVPKSVPRHQASISKTAAPMELTEEEKAAAKEVALRMYQEKCLREEEAKAKQKREKEAERKKNKTPVKPIQTYSPSLFD